QYNKGGHRGRDAIKIALTDCIYSPKTRSVVMAQCKDFGTLHLHLLLKLITHRHPFKLLVGDYLTLPKARVYQTFGIYLDTFSQRVWAFKYRDAGTAKINIDSLSQIGISTTQKLDNFPLHRLAKLTSCQHIPLGLTVL
ncbi:hypothetical protein BDR06DRAFT_898233, partial [Suillus hirtellus]